MQRTLSAKAERFTESVIREMTRLAMKYDAVNLAQGFPDFPAPAEIKEAARAAIAADINQYAITWGAKPLRDAIAEKFARTQGVTVDPEREITVCCGSTEAMMSSMMAHHQSRRRSGHLRAVLRKLRPRRDSLRRHAAFRAAASAGLELRPRRTDARLRPQAPRPSSSTRPTIPPARFSPARNSNSFAISACEWNAFAITDEIYEHILYDGAKHISMASLDGMRDRTITINGMSKTYSVTGWRVGWAIAPPEATDPIRKVHDFLTVGAAAPLAGGRRDRAANLPDSYYQHLAETYRVKRDRMLGILEQAGFHCFKPAGAYYIMTDISRFGFPDDVAFARYLVEKIGVAVVPGSSFYDDAATALARFASPFARTKRRWPPPRKSSQSFDPDSVVSLLRNFSAGCPTLCGFQRVGV